MFFNYKSVFEIGYFAALTMWRVSLSIVWELAAQPAIRISFCLILAYKFAVRNRKFNSLIWRLAF